jgi:hypothetical protein
MRARARGAAGMPAAVERRAWYKKRKTRAQRGGEAAVKQESERAGVRRRDSVGVGERALKVRRRCTTVEERRARCDGEKPRAVEERARTRCGGYAPAAEESSFSFARREALSRGTGP